MVIIDRRLRSSSCPKVVVLALGAIHCAVCSIIPQQAFFVVSFASLNAGLELVPPVQDATWMSPAAQSRTCRAIPLR